MLQGIIFFLSLGYLLILEKYDTVKKSLRKRNRVNNLFTAISNT